MQTKHECAKTKRNAVATFKIRQRAREATIIIPLVGMSLAQSKLCHRSTVPSPLSFECHVSFFFVCKYDNRLTNVTPVHTKHERAKTERNAVATFKNNPKP